MKRIELKYFTFFYKYLNLKVFALLVLSLIVAVLDGLGLAMFLPLLQSLSQGGAAKEGPSEGAFFQSFFQNLDIPLTINSVLIAMVLVFAVKGVFKFAENYYMVILRNVFIKKLRFEMIKGLTEWRYNAYTTSDVGKTLNVINGEIFRVVASFRGYFTTLQSAVLLVVYVIMAFFANFQFAIFVTVGALLINVVYITVYKRTKKLSRDESEEMHLFQSFLLQSVYNFKYLRATALMSKYADRLRTSVDNINEIQRKSGLLSSFLTSSREPFIIIVIAVVIYLQVMFFGSKLNTIILSLLFFYRSLISLMSMQNSWNSFLVQVGAIESTQEYLKNLDEDKEIVSGESFHGLNSGITIENLSFQYNEGEVILDNLTFEIHKNETIAFVGESGSGKSTLMNILSGLLDNYSGTIKLDDKSFSETDKETYRSKIGYITQEAVIFNDSLFNNITFWDEPNNENLAKFHEAISKAALTDFLAGLPKKENAVLGDNGILVSGGQKQRISIARELYKDVEILLLDEATSALDSETEKIIQNNIKNLKGKVTILMIAHRLSTVKDADRIVVLDKGKIEASGSFDELLLRSGKFKKMVEFQEF